MKNLLWRAASVVAALVLAFVTPVYASGSFSAPAVSPSVMAVGQKGLASGVVIDKFGNPIPGANVSVSGGFGPTSTGTTNAQGAFDLPVSGQNLGGPYPVTFSASNALGSFTQTYSTVTVQVVNHLGDTISISSLSGTSAQVGQWFNVEAALNSMTGNPVNGASMTFSTPTDSGASISADFPSGPVGSGTASLNQTTGTFSSGAAAVGISFDQPGTQVIQVQAGGATATITVQVSNPTPAQIAWLYPTPGSTITLTPGNGFQAIGEVMNSNGQGLNDVAVSGSWGSGSCPVRAACSTGGNSWHATTTTTSGQSGIFTTPTISPGSSGSAYVSGFISWSAYSADNFNVQETSAFPPGTITNSSIALSYTMSRGDGDASALNPGRGGGPALDYDGDDDRNQFGTGDTDGDESILQSTGSDFDGDGDRAAFDSGTTGGQINYTVTVTDVNGSPVNGASVSRVDVWSNRSPSNSGYPVGACTTNTGGVCGFSATGAVAGLDGGTIYVFVTAPNGTTAWYDTNIPVWSGTGP